MADHTDEHGFPQPQDDIAPSNPFASPLAGPAENHGYIHRADETLNPWVSMWTQPRETVRQQLDTDPEKHVLLLGVLVGVLGQLGNNAIAMAPDLSTRIAALVGLLIVGALFGLIWLFVGGWLFGLAGRMLGGVARAFECRTALAWSAIPAIWVAPLNMLIGLYYLMTGPEAIAGTVPKPGAEPPSPWAIYTVLPTWALAIMGIGMVVGIWQIVITSRAIGEAHQFSSLRGFGTMLLSGLLMMALMFGLAIVVGLMVAILTMAF